MNRRHPSEATLLAYVAGTLPVPHSIVIRTHLAVCGECRETIRLATALGGALLEHAPPAAMAGDALERTLAHLGEPERSPAPARIPTTVQDFATGRWWCLGPGIRLMPLIRRDRDDARLDLIRVAPGVALPGHGHTGSEITCVLQGAFGDETGEYHAGDVAEGDEDLDHQPVALDTGRECICLIATTGRLRGHSWLARLVQPMFGI
ncbi:ChrR family anti-sigma-E factor [Neoroseomonas soli]|uniref:Transcriptional regulator n=1 Tax=Neoroseomonas soli TaxID=1081025 RepID=A0A9X9WZ68_9PROT|nr:ChrR family anti-sigma-E factor [Neoroseomonas soli]MBR0672447.1 transcriptional regulator [Neoroseomonas soli]